MAAGLNVNVNDETAKALRELAERRSVSVTEIVGVPFPFTSSSKMRCSRMARRCSSSTRRQRPSHPLPSSVDLPQWLAIGGNNPPVVLGLGVRLMVVRGQDADMGLPGAGCGSHLPAGAPEIHRIPAKREGTRS